MFPDPRIRGRSGHAAAHAVSVGVADGESDFVEWASWRTAVDKDLDGQCVGGEEVSATVFPRDLALRRRWTLRLRIPTAVVIANSAPIIAQIPNACLTTAPPLCSPAGPASVLGSARLAIRARAAAERPASEFIDTDHRLDGLRGELCGRKSLSAGASFGPSYTSPKPGSKKPARASDESSSSLG